MRSMGTRGYIPWAELVGRGYRSAMIIEYIRYEVEPARADALIDAYTEAAVSLRASTHCLGYELSRASEAPATFVLRILWDSASGHMEGFRKSPEFRGFFAAIGPFVKQIVEMRHYEATGVVWSRVAS
jgi:quinol monooxygenase YgiN